MRIAASTLALLSLSLSCSSTSPTSPGAEGCRKDLDCKGARVCQEERCVEIPSSTSVDGGGNSDAAIPLESDATAPDAGPPDPLGGCAAVTLTTAPYPTVVEFIVDGSGSMDSQQKWVAAAQGLDAFFTESTMAARPDLAVGMIVFSDEKDSGSGSGPYPGSADVAPAAVDLAQGTKLHNRITTKPSGSTPTYNALSGGYMVLQNVALWGPLAGARKGIVLLTDGAPNGGTTEQAQCVLAAKDRAAQGIRTFAIGVGDYPPTSGVFSPEFLSDLAIVGNTRASSQCQPKATLVQDLCHVQVVPTTLVATMAEGFRRALHRSVLASAQCELKVTAGAPFDGTRVKVVVGDGQGHEEIVSAGGADGWSFDTPANPSVLRLGPAACAQVGGAASLAVQACPP